MANVASWQDYPMNLPAYEPVAVYGSELKERLSDPDNEIFSDESDIKLRITDIDERRGVASLTSHLYNSVTDVETILASSAQEPRIKIISIYSKRTIAPLQVTLALMQQILSKYEVHPDFLSVVFSFGQGPHIAEGSSSNVAIESSAPDNTKISYQIRYVEENHRGSQDPWSFRHTGIYHHQSPKTDLFIFLHPIQENAVEKRLLELEAVTSANQAELSRICQQPFCLHLLLFSSYFDNWRWYFRYLGSQFAALNDLAMVVKPENAKANQSFKRVQTLRNVHDLVLSSRASCRGNLNVVRALVNIKDPSRRSNLDVARELVDIKDPSCRSNLDVVQELVDIKDPAFGNLYGFQSQIARLCGYIESSDVLQGRIRNAIDLIGYHLDLHNQMEASKVDQQLRDLTQKLKELAQDTVDDSATVKIITFVSAFYLPGSFIGGLFGMNFFLFDSDSKSITIARNFWIFIATWLPLTLITGTIYILYIWLDMRSKGKEFKWLGIKRAKKIP